MDNHQQALLTCPNERTMNRVAGPHRDIDRHPGRFSRSSSETSSCLRESRPFGIECLHQTPTRHAP